ncbi:hypothetical protein CORAM0001_0516 [Corynebacterium amycolatum SK46]|nr:hypothetical protein CORAM0001_0516 [Corynebacterium amycolatum SK46]
MVTAAIERENFMINSFPSWGNNAVMGMPKCALSAAVAVG